MNDKSFEHSGPSSDGFETCELFRGLKTTSLNIQRLTGLICRILQLAATGSYYARINSMSTAPPGSTEQLLVYQRT